MKTKIALLLLALAIPPVTDYMADHQMFFAEMRIVSQWIGGRGI